MFSPAVALAHDEAPGEGKGIDHAAEAEWGSVISGPVAGATAGFSSSPNVEFRSQMPLNTIGGTTGVLGNDIWGWTDPLDGKEYALFGRTDGTSFIDVTDPLNPVYLGNLPSENGGNTAWRDIKVYDNHALIVADQLNSHGLQVFDLTQLRGGVSLDPFTTTASFSGFGRAHNIAVDEQSGFAYVVGANVASGGLYIIDVSDPTTPTLAGTYSGDGYTHDAQAVTYHGPDTAHTGSEIVFAANEDTLTIVDVTTKSSPSQLARVGYPDEHYSHQGWLTEDHRYFLMNDEADELNIPGTNTRTHVWDVADLDSPQYIGFHSGTLRTIDHNLYTRNGYLFEANYTSGLRILEPTNLATASFTEVGFFDTYPADNNVTFNGAWSVYPYFDSGTVIVSDRQNGLFVLHSNLAVPEPSTFVLVLLGVFSLVGVTRRRRRCR
jgi:choice-of-anchor B domain-containing protein